MSIDSFALRPWFAFGLLLGLSAGIHLISPKAKRHQDPLQVAIGSAGLRPGPMAKNEALFKVQLASESEAVAADDVVRVKGIVTAKDDLDGVQVRWILSRGFELVTGEQEVGPLFLESGVPTPFEIEVRRIGEEDSVLNLEASIWSEEVKLGTVASFALKAPEALSLSRKISSESQAEIAPVLHQEDEIQE